MSDPDAHQLGNLDELKDGDLQVFEDIGVMESSFAG